MSSSRGARHERNKCSHPSELAPLVAVRLGDVPQDAAPGRRRRAAGIAAGWRRLADPAGWRAVAYAVAILPLGIFTSTVALTGWTTAVSALLYPVYAPFLDQSSVTVNSLTIGGAGWQIATSLAGAVLLLVMPAVVRGLARLDAAAVRRLL